VLSFRTMSERYLVTAALPYSNGALHVGQIAGAYLPSDIFVRYLRMRGEDVHYVCGSDDHGVPITLTAEREGKSPREVAEYWNAHMKKTFGRFGIHFDNFSRTSTELHAANTQLFYRKLKAGGYMVEAASDQMYSPTEGRFLPDRYVEGTCPYCGYEEARGDQCDNCGRWYEAYQLIDPRSKLTGGPVEVRQTTHIYFDLTQFSDRLREWVLNQEHWRVQVRNFILGIIDSGLEKRPITRDLQWGVPVPEPGYEEKRFYVWFDAPIGYVSSSMEWARDRGEPDLWREYWQEPEAKLIHFIGKDNTVFHATVWPAMLMGVREDGQEPYILPYDISANEFVNLEVVVDGERKAMQMSTSRNLAVWLHEALDSFPADSLRFYIAAILPETGDVVFSWRELQQRVNSDLIGNLGNYINRVLSFTSKYFGGELPKPEELTAGAKEVLADFRELENSFDRKMRGIRPREALADLLAMGRRANRFFDASAPWKTRKEEPEKAKASLYVCAVLAGSIAYHATPYVPFAMEELRRSFIGPMLPVRDIRELPGAYRVESPKPLFKKVEDEQIAAAEGRLAAAAKS
jgi:methionyl-tRNA synthetase